MLLLQHISTYSPETRSMNFYFIGP